MKTLTIHFMDWAVVRTDNTGLINETGLVSWRKGGDTKVQLVTAFKAKPRDWLAAGGEKTLRPRGENYIECVIRKFLMQQQLYIKLG